MQIVNGKIENGKAGDFSAPLFLSNQSVKEIEMTAARLPRLTTEARFLAKIRKTPTCWEWTGTRNWKGYGLVSLNGRSVQAHRAVYELFVGPIPDGLQLDHLCYVKHCVNPAHLEPVTNLENNRRSWAVGGRAERQMKTHCPYGHAYEGDNIVPKKPRGRDCRECIKRRSREYKQRLKNKE